MTEEIFGKLSVRDVIIYVGRGKKFDGTEFKETKRRPAVIICTEEIGGNRILIAVPMNSTAEKMWKGPNVRYCINPTKEFVNYLRSLSKCELEALFGERHLDTTKFNNIQKVSQVAVNNALFVEKAHVKKKIGVIDSIDYEVIRYMFQEYCAWLKGNGLQPK